ncbi:MAG: VOC family protein [Pseudomonadota bacterium]
MSGPFVACVGGVVSADIAVPEHEREMRFYSAVLGTGERPLWREDLMNNLGAPIIGLGARSPEYADLPLQWMPHIQVTDVAVSASVAVELGGRELMHGKDDDGNSQWAVLQDPVGVAFGVIPVISPQAMPSLDEQVAAPMGRIAWLDLTVPDASGIRDFYRRVVGWAPQDVGMEDAGERYVDYNMCMGEGTPAAGICHARGPNAVIPPVWLIYLPVADLEDSVRRAREQGGEIIKTTSQTHGEHAYAVVRDPVGACFALVPG